MMDIRLKRTLIIAVLLLIALSSILLAGKWMSSPARYEKTIASIDDKSDTVLKLTASSTLLSAGISALPDDMATPIADKLADFTEYFLIILCVLYAEKYLLTIIGAATFKVLIPAACVLLAAAIYHNPKMLKKLAVKFILAGLALFIMIPLSVRVSDMVYATYREPINETITAAEALNETTAELSEADEDEGLIQSILSRISETATTLSDKAAKVLNNFVESLAVMIVTACIIPVIVLLFFIWLIKALTGIEINIPERIRFGHKRKATPGKL